MAFNVSSRTLTYVINGALLLVLGAAWTAGQFPAASSVISLTTLVSAAIFSVFVLTSVRITEDGHDHLSACDTDEVPQPQVEKAVDTQAAKEILKRYRAFLLGDSDLPFWPQSSLNPRTYHSLIYPYAPPARSEQVKIHGVGNFFDITPHDPENYTIKVGLVTITVRSGQTDIEIDSKGASQHPQATGSPIDVILRPDLSL